MATIITGFDIETTGLEWEKGHKIIEVACSCYDLDSQTRLGHYVQRINPQRSITPDAQAIHHITFEEVAYQPLFAAIAPKLHGILQASQIIVAHNGNGFDKPFTEHEFRTAGSWLPVRHWVDTMIEGRWATPLGKLPSLEELCFACDVPYDRAAAHAALYDVEVMMECFFRAYRKGFFHLPQLQQQEITSGRSTTAQSPPMGTGDSPTTISAQSELAA